MTNYHLLTILHVYITNNIILHHNYNIPNISSHHVLISAFDGHVSWTRPMKGVHITDFWMFYMKYHISAKQGNIWKLRNYTISLLNIHSFSDSCHTNTTRPFSGILVKKVVWMVETLIIQGVPPPPKNHRTLIPLSISNFCKIAKHVICIAIQSRVN